ncbi:TPA: site-specific DNA-methyltransferase [Proteus mirabilis]|uniref:site-specific DNA-methyltransferase n=1 Tax=Proteus mirabilis TaxID=584 RepID=UPI000B49800A|nr:site-specific DNA-methyltransferase [Proteus mirabilis]ASB01742.1 site-specific DNA-methyltransferase [Proteus mirabilis]EKV9647498.1 site-specific DNA-methyltransferase [Proteus mirabilis]ELA8986527.1 site-specific DNA-methyltransferase [Proteus mirabilis]MBG3116126.1 site-specific DNA-methyltransferase [Proteus mirabilis]MBI6354280.1 site-specific DNA-methyltransferase [Proteus mirabilis]
MDKLKMHSPDMTQQNIEKIQALFPNCVTESKGADGELKLAIDFDQLKQELSNSIVEGPQERYQLNWPGKREALLTANAPIAKTLRPCREESVNFDTTENLFIEGDNLDALKMLQETYLGKVKMIYIDPPYNTGKDFIYADDFAENTEDYLKSSGQKDSVGNRMIANSENNGRFHSDWLSMMYSRLKLSRNLMKDDGLIFISIDEVEISNLKKMADEIFGADNFIADFIWQNKKGGGNDAKYCAVEHEYVVIYAKNIQSLPRLFESFSDGYAKRYKEEDERGRFFWDTFKRKSGKQYYAITCPDGTVLENDEYGNPLSWLRSEARFKKDVDDGEIKFEKRTDGWSVMFKQRMPEGKKPRSLVLDKGTTSDGSSEILSLFGKNIFSNPKPTSLLRYLLGIGLNESEIVLDFFAGSATTAHAVTHLNAEDGGNRKFIMVQLPEECDKKSEAYKAGYKTIAEISKERIRRAGAKILEGECHKDWNKDVGFRVLKVDTSNMADVYYSPDQVSQGALDLLVDNIKSDRTAEDLLFQVLLDWGVDLTLPIRKEMIQGKIVFFVDDDALVACFDLRINEALIKELAAKEPLRVVFRDDGFESDAVKINAEQIFKQVSPHTEVKAI